jgi:hypothetical protein
LKKSTSSVLFRFYKSETEKTEPNRTQTGKKPEKTKPKQKNRAELKKLSQINLNRFLSKKQTEPN